MNRKTRIKKLEALILSKEEHSNGGVIICPRQRNEKHDEWVKRALIGKPKGSYLLVQGMMAIEEWVKQAERLREHQDHCHRIFAELVNEDADIADILEAFHKITNYNDSVYREGAI